MIRYFQWQNSLYHVSIIWPPPDIWRWLETHQWKLDKTCPLLPNNGIFHQEL